MFTRQVSFFTIAWTVVFVFAKVAVLSAWTAAVGILYAGMTESSAFDS